MKFSVSNNDAFCWPNKHSKLTLSEGDRQIVWMVPDRLFLNEAVTMTIYNEMVAEFAELKA